METFKTMDEAREVFCDGDYEILTDSEATEKASEYIRESLWAFRPEFLSGQTGIDESVFIAIQKNGRCEDNNRAVESCIDDLDAFCEAAIDADGRGHFIAFYDGEETEIEIDGETYYVYRIN